MNYRSTRNSAISVFIGRGHRRRYFQRRRLFVPESIPQMPLEEIGSLIEKATSSGQRYILAKYLTRFQHGRTGLLCTQRLHRGEV